MLVERKSRSSEQRAQKLMVPKYKIVGSFFLDGSVNGKSCLQILRDQLRPQLDQYRGKPEWLMQNGAPSH
jgi:hypothetical protein